MRRRIITLASLVVCASLLSSCHTRGILELSRDDTRRCDQMVARDGELLINLMTALNDFLSKVPGSEQSLQNVRAQCTDHLAGWDQFVAELYAKYRIDEEVYRLDVFRGCFSPKVMGERSSLKEPSSLRKATGLNLNAMVVKNRNCFEN